MRIKRGRRRRRQQHPREAYRETCPGTQPLPLLPGICSQAAAVGNSPYYRCQRLRNVSCFGLIQLRKDPLGSGCGNQVLDSLAVGAWPHLVEGLPGLIVATAIQVRKDYFQNDAACVFEVGLLKFLDCVFGDLRLRQGDLSVVLLGKLRANVMEAVSVRFEHHSRKRGAVVAKTVEISKCAVAGHDPELPNGTLKEEK